MYNWYWYSLWPGFESKFAFKQWIRIVSKYSWLSWPYHSRKNGCLHVAGYLITKCLQHHTWCLYRFLQMQILLLLILHNCFATSKHESSAGDFGKLNMPAIEFTDFIEKQNILFQKELNTFFGKELKNAL